MSLTALHQWNGAANWYDQNMGEEGDELNREVIRPVLLEMLGDLASKSVLDIGCGSGYFTAELAKHAESVVGTDFSEEFVSLCQKKYASKENLHFQVQDVMQSLAFAENSFDTTVVKMVLQYVEDIRLFADEASRVLRPTGKIVIAVDHPFNTQFHYAQNLAGVKNPKYQGLQNYFSKEPHTKLSLWGKTELTWYPKAIGDYLLPFVESGLRLNDLRELGEESNETVIPRILAFSFTK